MNAGDQISSAVAQYVKDVKSRDFPNDKEQY
jgi:ketopantoate hydroxymethyltransferase